MPVFRDTEHLYEGLRAHLSHPAANREIVRAVQATLKTCTGWSSP
jgi:hypothetical protein